MQERLVGWWAATIAARRLASIAEDVAATEALRAEIAGLTDEALGKAARELAGELTREAGDAHPAPAAAHESDGASRAFALAREATRRTLGLETRDVQLIAGFALARGLLAEMHTGEGKTLAAVHTACFHALAGRRVHVLTVNDYLAARDAEWMGPIYRMLGLSVAHVVQGMSREERRARYACDVTYATAKEAGFDFLRDSLAGSAAGRVQPALDVAIVDEADSILIDEARIPLVLAGRIEQDQIDPLEVAEVVRRLHPEEHYRVDREARAVELTEAGLTAVERALGTADLYAAEDPGLVADVANAVHAAALLERDVDYIVREGRIELVDELTGRIAEQRQWPDGLQAAIEAKEGVRVQPEGRVLNSITMQHFLAQYRSLTGMTATAASSRDELQQFYALEVLPVPRHRPCIRLDHRDRVTPTRAAKREAVLDELVAVHATGQPVVVGTASVAESEQLAAELRTRGVPCSVLNAKNDALEAAIIAEAGGLGVVTISTNMAGRGTDIRLGGADEHERDAVVALGGLHVIGTNRHESRRVDDQLRGRAGRQGDPGSSRFFASLEDELVRRYAAMELARLRLDSPIVRREIDRAQRIIDGQHFEIRKTLFQYSDLVDRHRQLISAWRDALAQGESESETAPRATNEPDAPWPPGWLAEASPARHEHLAQELGHDTVRSLEREICLRVIDRAWGDHLARLTELRASVHLNRYARLAPLDTFRKEAGGAFDALIESIERDSVRVFEEARIGADGIAWGREGLETPTSTWTYMINDQLLQPHPVLNLVRNPALVLAALAVGVTTPFVVVARTARRLARNARGSS